MNVFKGHQVSHLRRAKKQTPQTLPWGLVHYFVVKIQDVKLVFFKALWFKFVLFNLPGLELNSPLVYFGIFWWFLCWCVMPQHRLQKSNAEAERIRCIHLHTSQHVVFGIIHTALFCSNISGWIIGKELYFCFVWAEYIGFRASWGKRMEWTMGCCLFSV